jgi:hypothetical protein
MDYQPKTVNISNLDDLATLEKQNILWDLNTLREHVKGMEKCIKVNFRGIQGRNGQRKTEKK